MKELKYADTIEMKADMLVDAIICWLNNSENIEFNSKETAKDIQNYSEMIDGISNLDNKTRVQLSNGFYDAVNGATYDAFENGLKMGVNLLKSLLK